MTVLAERCRQSRDDGSQSGKGALTYLEVEGGQKSSCILVVLGPDDELDELIFSELKS